jgi:hypothetical protein
MSGAVCVLLATVAAGLDRPAQAECITQLIQQVPEGAHWRLYLDRTANRWCWILVDARGRELSTTVQAQTAATPEQSAFQPFLGNITIGGPPPPLWRQQQATAVPPAPLPPRRTRVVNVHRPVRAAAPRTEAHPTRQEINRQEIKEETRHEMSQPDRDALFEEFLRWHESRKITGAK